MTLSLIQVGLGGFGRSWAQIVRASSVATLAAVVDVAPEARVWAANTLGVPTFARLDEALAAHRAAAVLIATPPDSHHAVAIAALQASRHVLVEKPLASTLAEARDLIATADAVGRTLMVSQNYRFRPPARAAQAVVASGALGELVAVRIHFRRDTRTGFGVGNFRYAMRHPLLLDMSIHHFDLLRAVTGRNVSHLYAQTWRAPDSLYQHDPTAIVTMTLAGGATAVYDGDWASREGSTAWNAAWDILGEKGRLTWRGGVDDAEIGDLRLEIWGGGEQDVALPALPLADRPAVLAAFAEALATGIPPETRAADNIYSLAIVLGAVEAVETGRLIDLT